MVDLLSTRPFCSNDLMISSECKKVGDRSNIEMKYFVFYGVESCLVLSYGVVSIGQSRY